MTTLQMSFIEAQAAQMVKDRIAKCLAEDWLNIGMSWLHPDAGPAFMKSFWKDAARVHPFLLSDVTALARAGVRDADIALRELIAEHIDLDVEMPAQLAAYNIELLHPGRSQRVRGAHKDTNFLQDIAISTMVEEVNYRFPTIPFTGRSARWQSACSIVAHEISAAKIGRSLTGPAVKKIWSRYLRLAGRVFPPVDRSDNDLKRLAWEKLD